MSVVRRYVRCPNCGHTGTVTVRTDGGLTANQKFALWGLGIFLMFLFCSLGMVVA